MTATASSEAYGAFHRALAAEAQGTIPIERVWRLFEESRPPPGDPDRRRDLASALERAAAAGAIRLPSPANRKLWEREREPPLPVWVRPVRPGPARATGAKRVWHPTIAAAIARVDPGVRLPAGLDALDDWLKSAAHGAAPLPVRERSYEIFGGEKRLEVLLGSRFCVEGGLSADDLRCYRVMEPFVMKGFDPSAADAIALENLATYDSVVRTVATRPQGMTTPAAVIFGSGNQFVRTCESLPARLPQVRRLIYFGDLDPEGLMIALNVRRALAPGVAVVPWASAYDVLLARRATPVEPLDPRRAEALSRFFDDGPLRVRIAETLARGARIPQEAVSRVELEHLLARDRNG